MNKYVVIHPAKKLEHKTKSRHKLHKGLTFTTSWKKANQLAKKYGTEFRRLLEDKYNEENQKIIVNLITKYAKVHVTKMRGV